MDARAVTSKAETAFQTGDVGNGLVLGDRSEPMSALGQKQTSAHVRVMSALPPKADIDPRSANVRFVPKADILHGNRKSRLDYLVGAGNQAPWFV